MTTIFSQIIDGELPGRFVWRDPSAVGFLSINPVQPGHVLVVPRVEVDNWLDLNPDLVGHLMRTAQTIGHAQQDAFGRDRIGLIIAGLEVPHVHLHAIPITSEADLRFSNADPSPADDDLEAAAEAIRAALRDMGEPHVANS